MSHEDSKQWVRYADLVARAYPPRPDGQTLSPFLRYLALRRLDMSLLTIILTLTPVVTWVWSIALFGGRPSLQEVLGGTACLAGVVIVTSTRAGLLPGRRRR